MDNNLMVKVVKYQEKFFVWYKSNNAGFAQLLDTEGKKFSGTPSPSKLTVIKEISCKEFNRSWYFKVKQGVFSATTGDKIGHPKILQMFE